MIIFRMDPEGRARVASRSVGRWVRVVHSPMRRPNELEQTYHGYLVSLAEMPCHQTGWLIVLSQRLTADGVGDVALPLSQVRSIERADR